MPNGTTGSNIPPSTRWYGTCLRQSPSFGLSMSTARPRTESPLAKPPNEPECKRRAPWLAFFYSSTTFLSPPSSQGSKHPPAQGLQISKAHLVLHAAVVKSTSSAVVSARCPFRKVKSVLIVIFIADDHPEKMCVLCRSS